MSSSPTESAAPGAVPGASAATVEVLMPQMGTSMVEGTVVAWRVAVGDAVERDDVLCEVTTDKVDVECPAPAAGVVAELVAAEGETLDVGAVIARLAARDGVAAAAAPSLDAAVGDPAAAANTTSTAVPGATPDPAATARPAEGAAASTPSNGAPSRREALRRSSPVAARLAAEHGLDVLELRGTGRNGRVTKRDVLAAAEAPVAQAPALMHTESPYRHDPSIPVAGPAPVEATAVDPGPPGSEARSATPGPPSADAAAPGPGPVVPTDLGGVPEPASRMRRSIGAAVRRSLDTAAHCTTVVECDMSRIERERRERGLTALPLLAHHTIRTLREFPALNATFDGETAVRYGERVHLGIAVSLGDDGLIAPVIHDAQDLSVEGLARRIKDLAARARAGRLSPDEVRGGTFTITNPGAAGALLATPVINLPQVAILDLEAIVRRPVVVTDDDGNESIGIRPMVHLCMGWDHRALDGLYAAQFLTALRRRVEG
ncbi:dihydrolipoamide acetyltransferase family protein [Patulibacter americanus]|uniref:dihydrolipoamide acetyltransferase family protein n=1 Tax=Patulibacter americanus TaxID=588672 RepID=UPI001FDFCC24|nr:dihydrolipoamide acetyltransferase family protein [Patulibacter americanus]